MAGFYTHITVSTLCGVTYGSVASLHYQVDWATVFLGAGLTALGGMLPDLDSDSGKPVRELSGVAAAVAPVLLMPRLRKMNLTTEEILVVMSFLYLFIRYGMSALFKRLTVHRGMYHSIPAMLISGLVVYILYENDNLRMRAFLAIGIMIGFLSHLVLDEIWAVDLHGLLPRLNSFAGSALKFTSKSWIATGVTYTILIALGYVAWASTEPKPAGSPYALPELIPSGTVPTERIPTERGPAEPVPPGTLPPLKFPAD